jgi:hypothetical protein
MIVKAFLKIIILYFTKNIVGKKNIQPDIRLDIRCPALTGYPVSGKNSIRCIPNCNYDVKLLEILSLDHN